MVHTYVSKFPLGLRPRVYTSELSAPIVFPVDNIFLKLKQDNRTYKLHDGQIRFVWYPRPGIEFEGFNNEVTIMLAIGEGTIKIQNFPDEMPVITTRVTHKDETFNIIGFLQDGVISHSSVGVESISFHLVNFPKYLGQSIYTKTDNGFIEHLGRLLLDSSKYTCTLDATLELSRFHDERRKKGGFLVTHVGKICSKEEDLIHETNIESILSNLSYFFGFCCGAWVGPIFPYGENQSSLVWESLANWKVGPPLIVTTWFPTQTILNITDLFSGFMEIMDNAYLREPLKTAIAWYFEANSPSTSNEEKIVLSLIALETLPCAYLVDYKKLLPHSQFDRSTAEESIRLLLDELLIPTNIPDHLPELKKISHENFNDKDALEMLILTRNKLVHSTVSNREKIKSLEGVHLMQLGQTGIQLIELVILALSGYSGKYSRGALRGWYPENEVLVPWLRNP